MGKSEVVAILGGRGMLGTDLAKTCQQQDLDVRILDLPEFNITNTDDLREAADSADVIINCAAYTDVDRAESERESAYKVNAEAVGNLGNIAKKAGSWVLHIGTDFVFDGRLDRPYVETDEPNPINEYGRTKLAGERLLAESGCRHCIIRVQWTYGSAGNNFVKKLVSRAKSGGVKVVDDQTGSPTATTEVAKVICEILPGRPEGIYHFAGSGYVSRYGMAKFIFDKLLMDVELSPCKSSDFAAPAQRPLNSRFDCSRIRRLLNRDIEPWQGPLERFLG